MESQFKKQEKHQRDNLPLHLMQQEKNKKYPKLSRRKEIIKLGAEINEKE